MSNPDAKPDAKPDAAKSPEVCLRVLVRDATVVVLTYALLSYLIDGKVLQLRRAALFFGLFVALAYAFKCLDVDYQDQLTRVAGFQLGLKLFGALG